MLFTSLSKRVFGSSTSNSDKYSLKNKMNIIEFFAKAPNLIQLFKDEINAFIISNKDIKLN